MTTNVLQFREPVASVDLEVLKSFEDAQEEGEPDVVIELIDLYLVEAPRIFRTIREGIVTNGWLAAKRAAHSLRGSSGNLGILQMATIAKDLEHCDVATTDTPAQQLLQDLEAEFVRVEKILLAERQRRSS
jgi:HPt (histidine-containing phosphotransfer) domain-containing protein